MSEGFIDLAANHPHGFVEVVACGHPDVASAFI